MSNESKERSLELAKIAVAALDDKKAVNVRVIDISEVSVIADCFIVANGKNPNHIETLVDAVEEALYKAGCEISHREGNKSSTWVLLDFGDLIVHIFDEENRLFYNLERIWSDGKVIELLPDAE